MKKNYKKKHEISHVTGIAISITEMWHSMLKYSEIATDSTTPLEFRKSHKILNVDINKYVNDIEDRIDIGNISHNARINLEYQQWRQFTPNQILILKEIDGGTYLDKITEFLIRPPELLSYFDQVRNYFRWFMINSKSQKKIQH